MNQEIANTAKGVGLSVLKSKIFWYASIIVIGLLIIKKQFRSPPNEVILPPEDKSPLANSTWWATTGKIAFDSLASALKGESYGSQTRRLEAYLSLQIMNKAQLTIGYNYFNKAYYKDFKKMVSWFSNVPKTMTEVIDAQIAPNATNQTRLVEKLLSYNLI